MTEDVERKPTQHKDEILGIVQTKLSAAKRKKLVKSKDRSFPPNLASRPRTSFDETLPTHSLINRFKMKKRLADQWETHAGGLILILEFDLISDSD